MKKIKNILLILLVSICFIPISVFAAGSVTVSNTNLTITKGSTASFRISGNNAAGRVDISTSNSAVAGISAAMAWLDNSSSTITVTGNSVGNATIKVYTTDVTSYDDENLSGRTYNINVNVVEPHINKPAPTKPNKKEENKNNNLSKNNNASISIMGYDAVKVDDNNYTLTVPTNVLEVTINAIAEDSKAKIDGIGKHKLEIGENNIIVTVTSESGDKRNINIKITRKDGYHLEDLDTVLKDKNVNDITINKDSKLTSNDIEKIKKSKRIINLNYYDENNKLIYTWVINGNELSKDFDVLMNVDLINDINDDLSLKTNYAKGFLVTLKQNIFSKGLSLRLYIKDKYKNFDKLNVYYYDKGLNKLDKINSNVSDKDGYIEFNVDKGNEYFVTMASLNEKVKEETKSFNWYMLATIIETVIIISLLSYLFISNKKKPEIVKNSNNDILNSSEEFLGFEDMPNKTIDNNKTNVSVSDSIDEMLSDESLNDDLDNK